MTKRDYRIISYMTSDGVEKYYIQYNDDNKDEKKWFTLYTNGITPDYEKFTHIEQAKHKIRNLIKRDNYTPKIFYLEDE